MILHLYTPPTWTAALMPLLGDWGVELEVHEAGQAGGQIAKDTHDGDGRSMAVVFVEAETVAGLVEGWLAHKSPFRDQPSTKQDNRPLLVVVGVGSLRYEWQLREIGAADVVGHVWEASRVVHWVRQWAEFGADRATPSEDGWPTSVTARLDVAGVARLQRPSVTATLSQKNRLQ